MQKLEAAHQLQARIRAVLDTVERDFRPLTDDQLRWKPAPDQWSIVACLQHLNLAERFYIRNIQHKVDALKLVQTPPVDQPVSSDWVGRLMLYAIDPEVKIKLPAPGMVRPRGDLNPRDVMHQFVELQTLLHTLLDKAIYLDWNHDKVMTLFGNWLKLRLGDALLMLVAHTERHMNQAGRVRTELLTLDPVTK